MDISIGLYVTLICFSILGMILGTLGTIVGVLSLSRIIGIEKSTHSVQMMPVDPIVDEHNQKLMKDWGTSEEAINEQRDLYKEDLERDLPEFAPDEDPEIFSL